MLSESTGSTEEKKQIAGVRCELHSELHTKRCNVLNVNDLAASNDETAECKHHNY